VVEPPTRPERNALVGSQQYVLPGTLVVMVTIPWISWHKLRSQSDAVSSYRHLLGEGWALATGRVLGPFQGGAASGNRRTPRSW